MNLESIDPHPYLILWLNGKKIKQTKCFLFILYIEICSYISIYLKTKSIVLNNKQLMGYQSVSSKRMKVAQFGWCHKIKSCDTYHYPSPSIIIFFIITLIVTDLNIKPILDFFFFFNLYPIRFTKFIHFVRSHFGVSAQMY